MDKAENEKRAYQKKKRFKKIFVVLAVVLLALTFFSKSFYNYRLPVVTAALPRQGRLSFTVEGTSEFTYAYTESIYADIDGKIREILVDVGDEVKAGQTLMRVERSGTGEMYDVRSDKDGIISWIGVSKGIYVSSMQNTVLYEIAEKSEEWVCSLIISEEQFEHISMESVPVLELVDQNESVEGEISSIFGYDSQNLQGYKVNITVRSADASLAGERVKIAIREDGELLDLLESDRLAKAISRLKDRNREILFARVYGELTFAELGERFHMEPKQAEMAYYYVLRKLRKEMNGNDRF